MVTHQIRDAFYVATHEAVRTNGTCELKTPIPEGERAEFLVLRDGRIHVTGTRAELAASADSYLQEFLFMTHAALVTAAGALTLMPG